MDSNMKLKYGLINIQSVGNKTTKIRNLINEQEFDVFLLTETWLQGNISDSSRIKEMKPCTHNFVTYQGEIKLEVVLGLLCQRVSQV